MNQIPTLLVVLFLCLTACNTNSPADANAEINDSTLSDSEIKIKESENPTDNATAEISKPRPKPPKDPVRDSIAVKLSKKSPFLRLGCCEDKAQQTKDCCCQVVLAQYKIFKEKGHKKIAEYNMSDPILGPCKRLLVEEFDLIDHPPKPKEEADTYDDLF